MKTQDLIGPALDWAVEIALNGIAEYNPESHAVYAVSLDGNRIVPRKEPSTNWAQGGPIIERERIDIYAMNKTTWRASGGLVSADGPTPLIAAMRCYVASTLGDEVEIPKELQ